MSKAERDPQLSEVPRAVTDNSGGKTDEAETITEVTSSAVPSSGAAPSELRMERRSLPSLAVTDQGPTSSFLTSMRMSLSRFDAPLVSTSAKSSSPVRTSGVSGRPRDSSSKLNTIARKLNVRFGKVSFREYTASLGSAVRHKGGLTIAAVVMACVAIGAMVGLLLLSPGSKKEVVGTQRCATDECLRAFYYLEGAGDLLEDPCHDFYRQGQAVGYVCHRWQERGDMVEVSVNHFYDRLDNNLRFDSALELGSEAGAVLFAHAYRSCHQFLSSPVDSDFPPRVLDRLKTVVQRFSVSPTMDNLIKEIVRTSVTDGIDVLLDVSLAVHENDTYPIIMPGRSLREKLGNTILSEVAQIDASMHKALSGDKPRTQLYDLSTLFNLTPTVTPSLWPSLFKAFLNVSDAAKVLLTDAGKIQNVTMHLGNVLKKTQSLRVYLSLQAVADVIFFFIQKKLLYADSAAVERNCLQRTCLVMSHLCVHVTSRVFGWSSQTKRTVEGLYESVLKQYVSSGSLLWAGAGNWSLLSEGLNTMRLVQLPSERTDVAESSVARYEARLKEWPESFPEVYLVLSATQKAVSVELPLPSTQRYVIEAYLRGLILHSDLLPGLMVPTALTSAHMLYSSMVPVLMQVISFIFSNRSLRRELNLGTVGALIAYSLVMASTPARGGSLWTPSMRREFKVKTTCFYKSHRCPDDPMKTYYGFGKPVDRKLGE
ncbi:hypothetical protein V5799_011585 [Amblyomma americanum]|uniref:Uncharacterized protein n=1 Tax=Amblyomma americanum TaxID=6943 RepID=A0AAQ4EGG0_AMBAM